MRLTGSASMTTHSLPGVEFMGITQLEQELAPHGLRDFNQWGRSALQLEGWAKSYVTELRFAQEVSRAGYDSR